MNKYLQDVLRCPDCKAFLEKTPTGLVCVDCGKDFAVKDGIYVLLPNQQEPTPKFYDVPDYQRFVQRIARLHAVHYKSGTLTGLIENDVKKRMARLIKSSPPPYVDLGCGTGKGFAMLGPDKDILGIDNNMDLLRECRRQHPEATLVCCDMRSPPFKMGAFLCISCIGTLEHIFHLEAFVASTERILADDGFFYVEVPTEGGLLWNLGRALVTAPRNSRLLGVDYQSVITREHCNTIHTVHNVLKKYFVFDKVKQYPFGFGGFSCNIAIMYRLRKMR